MWQRSAPMDRNGPCEGLLTATLSAQLRAETVDEHRKVEQKSGLPGVITSLAAYRACLQGFYRLYLPLEAMLMTFPGWNDLGIELPKLAHSPRLARDLQALGMMPLHLLSAPPVSLPILLNFSNALGALYVLEGSTLGSQIILRHLQQVLGPQIAGADSFFSGHGDQTSAMWHGFRTSLDRYGEQHPAHSPDVIQGAKATFLSIAGWMHPGWMCPR